MSKFDPSFEWPEPKTHPVYDWWMKNKDNRGPAVVFVDEDENGEGNQVTSCLLGIKLISPPHSYKGSGHIVFHGADIAGHAKRYKDPYNKSFGRRLAMWRALDQVGKVKKLFED